MKRPCFTEVQIISMLREPEAGMKTSDVSAVSTGHFWSDLLQDRAKFGGMDVYDARKLKVLEDETTKLKKLLAEPMLDNAMLKDVASKNGDTPSQRCSASPVGHG